MEKMLDAYQQEFHSKYGVRTDLAVEAHEVIVETGRPSGDTGVIIDKEQTEHAEYLPGVH